MDKPEVFLTAKWKNLVFLSYHVEPELLLPLLPPNIEADLMNDKAVVTLAAFDFVNTKIKGIPLPVYGDFSEINLRFNVTDKNINLKGVVFIKELVPKSLIAAAANTIYNEKYETAGITASHDVSLDVLKFNYTINEKHTISVITESRSCVVPENTAKYNIKQRNAGFGTFEGKTIVYEVKHGEWDIFPVINHAIKIDFGELFGAEWKFLNDTEPFDITTARGSLVEICDWQYYEY